MHYAVVIPMKTEDNAKKVLKAVIDAGLGAVIERRVSNDEKEEGD